MKGKIVFLVYGRNQTEGKQLINGKEHKFSFLSYTCTIKIDVRGPFPRISEKKRTIVERVYGKISIL